jgi:hypothetical protein
MLLFLEISEYDVNVLIYKCKIAVVTTNFELIQIWITSKHKVNILSVGHLFFTHLYAANEKGATYLLKRNWLIFGV